jgi:glutamate formiminotransferase
VLIESVPNVSEGRRLDVVDRMASAIEAGDGVFLLDRTSDASHNRSVFTIAGEHDVVADALERLVEVAVHEIDMDSHTGEHPRIGAVDVIPFVPLGTTTMDDAVEMARDFGARIASPLRSPGLLYANAATRPERVKLADVRAGQYEGLKNEIEEPGRSPDFGPSHLHPSAGAIAVGARPFLIAYNINLASKDVELAKRIARRVRESGGGLPKVQANGFWIEELGRAQVSMNILDFTVTPLWLVWETVRDVAAEDGVLLAESELIGLAPLAAFLAVATVSMRRQRIRSSDDWPPQPRSCDCATSPPMQALELRLEDARATGPTAMSRRAVPAHPRRPQRRADAGPADRRCLGGRDPRGRCADGGAPGDVERLSAA